MLLQFQLPRPLLFPQETLKVTPKKEIRRGQFRVSQWPRDGPALLPVPKCGVQMISHSMPKSSGGTILLELHVRVAYFRSHSIDANFDMQEMFPSPCSLSQIALLWASYNSWKFVKIILLLSLSLSLYIYIYMCVCVCVCVIVSKKVHINMCPIFDGYGVMGIF